MSSLVSAKGPSRTVRCEPEKRTRLAFDVGVRPSPASMTPAFTSSSLNFIILPTSSRLGIVPASELASPGTNTITRIGLLLFSSGADAWVEHRTNLGLALEAGPVLAMQIHELRGHAHHVGLGIALKDGPAADDLFAFAEGAVGHGEVAAGDPDAGAVLAGQEAAGIDEAAVLAAPLHELPHHLHEAGRRRGLANRLGMTNEREK